MPTRAYTIILVGLFIIGCGGSWRQTEADRLGLDNGPFASIRVMLRGGRSIEARQSLAGLPINLRETPQWSYLMGRTLMLNGDADGAIGYLEDAHRRMPGSTIVQNDLAVALIRAGRAGHAVPLLENLVAAHPKDRDLLLNRAVALTAVGRAALAQESLSRLARRFPDWFDARFDLALAALGNNDAQTAVFEFRQAERLKPGDRDTLLGLAVACARFQDPVCSEQAIRKVLGRYPEDPRVLMGWGNHQEEAGDLDGALKAYGKATQVAPDCSDCWYCLGRTADRLGDKATAVRAFKRHVETAPGEDAARPVLMRLKELEKGD